MGQTDFLSQVDVIVTKPRHPIDRGTTVTISIDIQANSATGFDESLQRTIKENCSVLKFGSAEFEGTSCRSLDYELQESARSRRRGIASHRGRGGGFARGIGKTHQSRVVIRLAVVPSGKTAS
jgi:hypothetical protein